MAIQPMPCMEQPSSSLALCCLSLRRCSISAPGCWSGASLDCRARVKEGHVSMSHSSHVKQLDPTSTLGIELEHYHFRRLFNHFMTALLTLLTFGAVAVLFVICSLCCLTGLARSTSIFL